MGRNLLRRKALALLALALALQVGPARAGGEAGGAFGPAPELLRALRSRMPSPEGPAPPLPVRHGRSSEPEFGLEIPDQPAVRYWEERLVNAQGLELVAALERGRMFRRHIAERLRENGCPQELLFLPVLESHYRARAVSRSGAVGLWQIMSNTAAPLGLRRNLWLDERRDFWLATDAAIRKLAEDYRRFGSWPLALAAYNCGGSCVSRAIRAGGTRDYWELRARGLLPRETAEYVPKFFALVRICSYPGRYDLPASVSAEEPQRWVRIDLERSVELALLSQVCGIPEQLLRGANAELNLGVTPPPTQGYALKIPANSEARVRAALADPQSVLLRYQYHTVRSGDTFYGLSRHYGVAAELIQAANPTVDPRRIRIATVLKIPVVGGALPEPPPRPVAARVSYTGSYTVQIGDTLWAISRRYGITAELLASANGRGLDEPLQPGETLTVPGTGSSREGSRE